MTRSPTTSRALDFAPHADYLRGQRRPPEHPDCADSRSPTSLPLLLTAVKKAAGDTPVLVKIAPDLTDEQARIAALAVPPWSLDGIIATNTTLSREGA